MSNAIAYQGEQDEVAGVSLVLDGEEGQSGSEVEIFHEITKLSRNTLLETVLQVRRYLTVERFIRQSNLPRKRYPHRPSITLEKSTHSSSLAEVLSARQSCRSYRDQPLGLEILSTVLNQAVGLSRMATVNGMDGVKIYMRPYPSGGGLYPVEFYPILLNVTGVQPCVTHYDAVDHRLHFVRVPLDVKAFQNSVGNRVAFRNSAAAVVMTAVFPRSVNKYGPRGYRFALLEAGHAAQNLCLAATSLGLGSLVWGEYYDDEINDMLDVDGVVETVVNILFLGHPDGA